MIRSLSDSAINKALLIADILQPEGMVEKSLNKDSLMECPLHGAKRPAFICTHLQYGAGLGFHQPDDPPGADWPFENAWCGECDRVLIEEGEWNERSEGFADIIAICEGCFEKVKQRNTKK